MISKFKYIISCLVAFQIWCASMYAQQDSIVVQMDNLVDVYEELNRLYPFSDYVTLKQGEVAYWVNRTMRSEYDFVGDCQRLKPLIDKLKALPCIGQKVIKEGADTPAEGIVFACHPSFRDDVQNNYIELVFNRNTIHFLYTSKLKESVIPYESNDRIADEMDNFFAQYISRPEVYKFGVQYDGPTYQYQLVTFNNPQKLRQHAEGVIYTVPNCSIDDWNTIFEKIKGYALTNNVDVAWNDVYRHYESVEILIQRASTIPIVFAATYRDETLKLLRIEGTENYNIVLPRIWSEDTPVFNPKKNKDYYKQK